jgi:hypothetical protein
MTENKAPTPGDTLVWTNSGIEVRVTELTPAAVVFEWSNGAVGQLPWNEWFNHLQPAPKPEWKPGTMTRRVQYKKGDLVVLLSIPGFGGFTTTWLDADHIEDIGQVHPIDKVRLTAADGIVYYDVAGWTVTAENIRQASKEDVS